MEGFDVTREEIERLIEERLSSCRVEVDSRITMVHTDMAQLRAEFHDFRVEMHSTSTRMSDNLERIADHMEKLADLPEAWANFKGFMGFMRWIKEYWFVFVIGGGLVLLSLYAVAKSFNLI